MNILHLSDLHLGKRIYECSMIEEQRHVLWQVLALAREADVTLIAGDLYDRPVPPAEAVALFDEFLTRMSAQGSTVVMIAGNHDSAERIAFGSRLMDGRGIYVSPVYDGAPRRVTLEDAHGPVHIYLLPFVKPAHVRAALGREDIEGYTQAVRAAIEAMNVDSRERNVLLAHQFVTGAGRSESEEVSVGGLDNVDADVFAPFDYVALGHLHAAQSLEGGRVRYSGAPLAYAFSEAGQEKGALMVRLGPKGDCDAQMHPLTPLHPLTRVRGNFAVLASPDAPVCEDYVQVTLTDEDDIAEAAGRLREVYPNLLEIRYDNVRTRAQQADFEQGAAMQDAPLARFEELFALQNGQEMSREQREYLSGLMERIWEDEQ